MKSTRYLKDKERTDLLAKYKADRENDAPANISDKTLIENYGTDEQKALLAASTKKAGEAAKAQEPTTTTTTDAAATQPAPAPAEPSPVTETPPTPQNDAARDSEIKTYVALHGKEPAPNTPTDEIRAQNLTTQKENEQKASQEYVNALNDYIALNGGQAPKTSLTLDELIAANNAKKDEIKNKSQSQPQSQSGASAPAGKETPNVQSSILNKGVDKVTMINQTTGKSKVFPKFTYEQYMKNDKDWMLAPSMPNELKDV